MATRRASSMRRWQRPVAARAGVTPSWSCASTSARRRSSSRTMSGRSCRAAACSGVWPEESRWPTAASCARSSRQVSTSPRKAALCSAVRPPNSDSSTLAPRRREAKTSVVLPCVTAACSFRVSSTKARDGPRGSSSWKLGVCTRAPLPKYAGRMPPRLTVPCPGCRLERAAVRSAERRLGVCVASRSTEPRGSGRVRGLPCRALRQTSGKRGVIAA
mmetsp:Transcript_101131/g.326420  ORF Transcript_101131/g.326420 Transcript_101131/m.326420 type:complete len:217 (-) Transcript_101131:189-839(-)